ARAGVHHGEVAGDGGVEGGRRGAGLVEVDDFGGRAGALDDAEVDVLGGGAVGIRTGADEEGGIVRAAAPDGPDEFGVIDEGVAVALEVVGVVDGAVDEVVAAA